MIDNLFYFPLLIGLGFFIAIVTTMSGIGGGLFFVPLIMFFDQVDITIAREISQLTILGTTFVGAIMYMRQKRVNYKVGAIAAGFSVIGVLIFKFYFQGLKSDIVTITFGGFLIFIALYFSLPILIQKWKQKHALPDAISPASPSTPGIVAGLMGEMPIIIGWKWLRKAIPIFIGAGFLGAMLGIGGGIIFVPTFHALLDFPVHFSTATSSFVIVFNSLSNVLIASGRGQIDLWVGISLIAGATPGAFLGAKYSQKVPKDVLKGILSAVLGVIGIILLVGALLAL